MKPPSHHYKRLSKEFCTQKMKENKSMRGEAVSVTGEEKTRNQRVAFIQLHTNKSLNTKNN
jgi:hypothetical protein